MKGLVKGKALRFNLVNVHFHTHSEHTINGKPYPIEMHIVHALDKNSGVNLKHNKLVIGVFFSDRISKGKTPDNRLLAGFNLDSFKVLNSKIN